MAKEVILDNEFATLWYDPAAKIISHQIKKFIPTPQLKELLNKGNDVMKTKGAKKWLSDDRNNGALPQDAQEWSAQDWFPRMVKAGWKFWALLVPGTTVGQLSIKRRAEEYSKAGVTTQVFSDAEAAQKWLEAQAG